MRPSCRWFLLGVSAFWSVAIGAQSIFTVAGGGSDDGRPATVAALDRPVGTAIDSCGNLYIADRGNHRVRRVDGATGIITTVAGTGSDGFDGDGEPATQSQLAGPMAVAFDRQDNLLIADLWNDRIRRVDRATGVIQTFAGTGYYQSDGDGGPATQASIKGPAGMIVDSSGDVFVVDAGGNRVRKISAASGVITTVAGNGTWGDSGDGGPATMAAFRLSSSSSSGVNVTLTRGLAIEPQRRYLYVSDSFNHRVRRVDLASGIVTTIAGSGQEGFSGDRGPATAAKLDTPSGLALSSSGDLYVADGFNNRVRRVSTTSGLIDTVAGGGASGFVGDGGPATSADISAPSGLVMGLGDSLFVASALDSLTRVIDFATRTIHTVAGNGLPVVADENAPAVSAGLNECSGIAFDAKGNLYIADRGSARVRQVAALNSSIRTIAGVGRHGSSLAEGTPATQTYLSDPMAVAVDRGGDVYVASVGESRIKRISMEAGTIRTYAGTGAQGFAGDGGAATQAALNLQSETENAVDVTHAPGLVFDGQDNLYIADRYNYRIRKVDRATGLISTVAGNGTNGFSGDGGPATLASMGTPAGLVFDGNGNLIVADPNNDRVRRIDASNGTIRTVAGSGTQGSPSDGVPATQAVLWRPQGVAVDGEGNIYITDGFTHRLLRVDAATGMLRRLAGISMQGGFTGDRGPAMAARLSDPEGLAIRNGGDVYIAETGSSRVRAILACVAVGNAVLTSPANGSSGLGQMVRLSWSPSPGAFSYDVYLDKANPPIRLAVSSVETTSFSPSGLTPGTTYHWRIVAKGDPFCSPPRSSTSEVWSFTTANTCAAPGAFIGQAP